MHTLSARVVIAGSAAGVVLRLTKPISFWGGIDPDTGRIIDPRHPDHGVEITGRVLAIPATVGSSSSSAVLLELLRNGRGPAALLLGGVDAILTLGVVVAKEMGYRTIPVLEVTPEQLATLPQGQDVRIDERGVVSQVSAQGQGRS